MSKFIITTSSWASGAVIPQNFKALAEELVARGHPTLIIVDGHKKQLEQDGLLSVKTWPSKHPRSLTDFIFFIRVLKTFQPDCVIGNFSPGVFAIIISWLLGIKNRVLYTHSSIRASIANLGLKHIHLQFQLFRRRCYLSLATHHLAVSQAVKQELVQIFHVNPNKCYIFYNCMPAPTHVMDLTHNQEYSNPRLVCTGRLVPGKGQRILLKAFAIVLHEAADTRLVFLGDGVDREDLQALAENLGVSENCLFLGSVPHEQVLAELSNATLAVFPTLEEGFGLVVIEAMSMAVPVIASAVGGIVEIFSDGKEGFLIPPNDPEALADKITLLVKNPQLCHEIGNLGRVTFLSRFEQSKVLADQADWLEKIARA